MSECSRSRKYSDTPKKERSGKNRRRRRRRKHSDSEDEGDSEEAKSPAPDDDRERERGPVMYVADLSTKWTIAESDGDPVYVRDSDASSFVPLPRAETETRPTPDPRIEEHFIGVKTSEEAGKIVKPDDFVLYYKQEDSPELDISIPLYLAHRNTRNKLFHFPIVRTTEESGAKWWHVQFSNNMSQSVRMPQFRQLSDLVRCYHLYRFTDARTGRMEVFPLWKGGVIDDYK